MDGNNLSVEYVPIDRNGEIPPKDVVSLRLTKAFLNDLTNRSWLSQLTNVTSLYLSGDCELRIPEDLPFLQKLETLSLRWNLLTDSSSIVKLTALKELYAESCELYKVPEEWYTLGNLEILHLVRNDMSNGLSPSIGKLKKLRELNLQFCLASELPEELWTLENLEKLYLTFGDMPRGLSPSIGKLKKLKEFDVGYCEIPQIPEELWTLENMEKLWLQHNEMPQGLSSSICKLKALNLLNIGYCSLRELPDELWTLENLSILLLNNNYLVEYPAGTLLLPNLSLLDLSNRTTFPWGAGANSIKELPESLKDSRIETLILDGNPIVRPPETIWNQGVQAVKLYFKELTSGEQKFLCVDTINIIGESEAGKTSIAKSLVQGQPVAAAEDDRTRVMQRLQAKLPSSSADSPVYVNDFGGHHIYRSIIPLFLPCSGLTILVYNLLATNWSDQLNKVRSWLHTAIAKSVKIRLLIVGTRSDLVEPHDAESALGSEMQDFVLSVVNELKRDIEKHINKNDSWAMDSLFVESFNKRQKELKTLLKKIEQATLSFATISCKIPEIKFFNFRTLVGSNLNPVEAIPASWWKVMQEILRIDDSGFPRRTIDQVQNLYKKYISNDPDCRNLPVILRYLANSSQIIWVESNPRLCFTIFHSPQGIVDICTQLLDHRALEDLAKKHDQVLQRAKTLTVVLDDDCIHRVQPEWEDASEVEKSRYQRGILQETLLRKLLVQYTEQEIAIIVAFLEHFDLISEIKLSGVTETNDPGEDAENIDQRAFLITSNIPEEEPRELKTLLKPYHKCFSNVLMSLSFAGCIVPFAFFATSLASILAVTKKLTCGRAAPLPWKYGVCIRFDALVLLVKCHEDEKEVTFAANSINAKQSPWFILYPVLERLQENISRSWPGAAPQWHVMCPGCSRLKEVVCDSRKVSRRPVFFKELTSNSQQNPNYEDRLQVFEDCSHLVPRSLCHVTSQNSFTDEEQREIAKFFEDLDEERAQKSRPDGEPLLKRQKTSEPDSEEDNEISPLKKRLASAQPTLVKELDSSTVNCIVDELIAARDGCGLISEEDSQLIRNEKVHKDKARLLLGAIRKRGDDAIKLLITVLASPEVNRKDLANKILRS